VTDFMDPELEAALSGFGLGVDDSSEDEPARLVLDDVCLACRLGYHVECELFWEALAAGREHDEVCCCEGDFSVEDAFVEEERRRLQGAGSGYVPAPGSFLDSPAPSRLKEFPAYWGTFLGMKPLDEYVDALSAGRKIAAEVAPIDPGKVCEWAWLARAGGGVVPIIGCPGRPMSDRHHGPDKNTMRNEVGTNLHRICDWCHNQWHAKNDPFYGPRAMKPHPTEDKDIIDPTVPFEPAPGLPSHPHDPHTRATDQEVYAEDAARREEARRHGANI
jgi:hypothetical protein